MKMFCHSEENYSYLNIFKKQKILSVVIDINQRFYFVKSNQDLLLHNFLGLNNKQEW